ncbi:hypothetical protein ScalyP_jg7859 [Parmales sp. scaly parma]|nr:hypothetical protein ScalyP_jg7859 [Parmales sp. scaly parma]
MTILALVLLFLFLSCKTTTAFTNLIKKWSPTVGRDVSPNIMNANAFSNLNDNERLFEDEAFLLSKVSDYLKTYTDAYQLSNSVNEVSVKGGSRDNFLLRSLSLSPPEISVNSNAIFPLDYGELSKNGYDELIKPIMKFEGGRKGLYEALGLTPPAKYSGLKKRKSEGSPIMFDSVDAGAYSGLRVGAALESDLVDLTLRKAKKKIDLDTNLLGPDWKEQDVSNVPPPQQPMWTAAMLDAEAEQRGKALSWASRERELNAGRTKLFKGEALALEESVAARVWLGMFCLSTSFAFGQATSSLSILESDSLVVHGTRVISLLMGFANVGTAAFGAYSSPENKAYKVLNGLSSGPLTLLM